MPLEGYEQTVQLIIDVPLICLPSDCLCFHHPVPQNSGVITKPSDSTPFSKLVLPLGDICICVLEFRVMMMLFRGLTKSRPRRFSERSEGLAEVTPEARIVTILYCIATPAIPHPLRHGGCLPHRFRPRLTLSTASVSPANCSIMTGLDRA